MLEFIALPAFQDNYIWLIVDNDHHRVAVVDPGDAVPVITWLGRRPEYDLTHMLITHHHRDHTGGLATIKAATGCKVWGPAAEEIPGLDRKLDDGETLSLFGQTLEVISVPGHTRGHIAFFCNEPGAPWLLSGDTLFAGGCGRLFEGTAEQMHRSLQRLAALPDHTRIYCAHEYTQANLRFARAVEPDNADIKVRAEVVDDLRAAGRMTLPSSIGLEKKTNPFLRAGVAAVINAAATHAGEAASTEVNTFARIRAWKDSF
ncbi:hydroxyacylglutathione hydrolase [Halopseudomonas pelagia]|uniref:hydroxyacylglutathione hydrolase n=1 Tax=Halopseudomonas pelagia TaxID=553151 RepID=UPI0003A00199|nr:hydroxyacylglutathione hydrolase [Halopseudomonas pelagia]|tara:strand:+ start:44731 stop:45510 length:780 start_codon:yes stop_codon:yes gene_type:complete